MFDYFTTKIRDFHLLKRGEPIGEFEKILVDRLIDGKHVVEKNYKKVRISEMFKNDINNVFLLQFSIVRPIIGTFGSGKSMTLKQAAMIIEKYVKNACISFIELTKYGGEQPHIIITRVYKEIINSIAQKLRECLSKDIETIKALPQKRLREGLLNLVDKNEETFGKGKMILMGEVEGYEELSQAEALNILEEIIRLTGKNKYIVVLLFDELERFMTVSDDKTKQAFIGTYLRAITDKTVGRVSPKIYVVFTCEKEKFEEIPLIVPEVERTIREYILYLNEFSEEEFFEVAEKIYKHLLAPFQHLFDIMPPTPGLCAMFLREISNYTPSELVTKLSSYYIKNYNLDATYLLNIERGYKKLAFQKFQEQLIARGYEQKDIKKSVEYVDFAWDGVGFNVNRKKSQAPESISVGQFTILKVMQQYVEDYINQLKYLKEYEQKRKKDALVHAILIAPGFDEGVELLCAQNGIECVKFSEKPKKLEEWEGIVSSKQVQVPEAEKIAGALSATKQEKLKQLEQILNSSTSTKIREIAKSFHIDKIYGIKKADLVKRILKELPENIEREIQNLS
ncbi:MAG TPA: hypothetical protein VMV49_03420 [Candidatus Deferrimicrobium sp.]|nr:hypothetical protein [Candidatus Deferrimicrobium sp.]